MRKLAFGLLVATAGMAASSAASAAVLFDFSSAPGNIGPTHTYTSGGLSVTASGFNPSGSPIDLFGKNFGGDENGIGLAGALDNEIATGFGFVQLDVGQLLGKVSLIQFFTGSTTNGETWNVYGSHTAGSYSGSPLISGTTEEIYNALPGLGTYKYYDFVSSGYSGDTPHNFLIGGLSVVPSVPEPATWALMILGFGMIGGTLRRRRATTSLRYTAA
ncbi:PEPxxWA-CTERM sorting domain-containing protein [uncultured Sphingomonas sp.]|uniref:PEPxxWA-CTERM sorting domain-containing protein n=1 Tax=uncultured Sphingomonas sp. TaxID=158754 RepID=UPI00262CFB0F|nr:PEPxxWA-CTERM sorting domain-containing protein [uncultured Sphingomonas sp.]